MLRGLTLTLLLLPSLAWAEEGYVLTYRGQNEWVAQEDMKPLRQLLKDAKTKRLTNFTVARNPQDNEQRGVNRVLILRDILNKNIKVPLTITEVPEDGVAAGTIVVRPLP